MKVNPILVIDDYKTSHRIQHLQGIHRVYSNFTSRSNCFFSSPLVDGEPVFFGLQGLMQWPLVDLFNEAFLVRPKDEAVSEYKQVMDSYLGKDAVMVSVLTIIDTQPEFFWSVDYLEAVLLAELRRVSTNATIAHHYRKICARWAEQTCSDLTHLDFQCRDFSFRGISGLQDTMQVGSGHPLSFKGIDSIPSLLYAHDYYTDSESCFIGANTPATEHSMMCMGEREHEIETSRRLIADLYPQGLVPIVSDIWDYRQVLMEYTRKLKNIILAREGRVVFRPDSGNPAEILRGIGVGEDTHSGRTAQEKESVEVLWEIFGGMINAKGYKVLDPHVGLIHGDSITLGRANEILCRLETKGLANPNVVFGVGSFTCQYNTRDIFGFAIKMTWGEVDGKGRTTSKEPKTDSGLKRSARGLLRVTCDGQEELCLHDERTWEQGQKGGLKTRFLNGKLFNREYFEEIRQRLAIQG